MSTAPETSLSHWVAQGVRHELLLRLLPSIRHDMLGPISVARMGVAVLVKRLGSEPPNLEGTLERARELNQHLALVTHQLREFRHWDPDHAGHLSLPAAVNQCAGWLQPVLTLQGFELELAAPAEASAAPSQDQAGPGQPAAEAPAEWPRDELLLLIAGMICHALDCWAPCQLQIEAGAASLLLRAGHGRPAPPAEHLRQLPPTRQVLLPALAALAEASHAVLAHGPGLLALHLARSTPHNATLPA